MCEIAIKIIIEQRELKKALNKKVVLEPELVIRESTKNKLRD
jgi:DNA-binding LacI/PurR family transcriptional regulator